MNCVTHNHVTFFCQCLHIIYSKANKDDTVVMNKYERLPKTFEMKRRCS